MTRAIQQTVRFAASPKQLFETYMDSKKHSAATGARARISRKVGGRFTAFDRMLRGKTLVVVSNRLIVQSWRAKFWKAKDPDSILVIELTKVAGGCRVDLVHVNVPPYDHRGVREGWKKYYWKPWKAYLAKRLRTS